MNVMCVASNVFHFFNLSALAPSDSNRMVRRILLFLCCCFRFHCHGPTLCVQNTRPSHQILIMSGRVAARLAELGLTLPTPAAPAANYMPFVKSGSQIHIAGQLPKLGDNMITGKLGEKLSIEEGQKAAKACAINLLAQANAATGGNLDRVKRVVKINVFVNSTPDFVDQPKVANGASDFLVEVLGDAGRHARSAVGVATLPFGVAVEIDGIFEVDETSSNL